MSKEYFTNKINHLYFKKHMTTQQIADSLGVKYQAVHRQIDRKAFFAFDAKLKTDDNPNKVDMIQREVCDYYKIPLNVLHMRSRFIEILLPRQIAHHLAYNLTKSSNKFIGQIIGNYDHATVNNSRGSVDDYLLSDNKVRVIYEELEKRCKAKLNG